MEFNNEQTKPNQIIEWTKLMNKCKEVYSYELEDKFKEVLDQVLDNIGWSISYTEESFPRIIYVTNKK